MVEQISSNFQGMEPPDHGDIAFAATPEPVSVPSTDSAPATGKAQVLAPEDHAEDHVVPEFGLGEVGAQNAESSVAEFKIPADPGRIEQDVRGQFYGPSASFSYGSQGGTVTWPSTNNLRPMRPSAHSGMSLAALAPVPQARPVPVLHPPYSFQVPRKRINSQQDINHFHQSESGRTFLGFVVALSESIRGHKLSDFCRESPLVIAILRVLELMSQWVDEIPPKQQPVRYGNPAYRDWYTRLCEQGQELMLSILPPQYSSSAGEIFLYFADSFGNATRIDYGTGHETNFAAWLLCLARLGLLNPDDYQAIVSRVFVAYLYLMRKLQTTYWLEPAGSHGVWGLDDYHFLPFIFGASQLIDHKYMKPKSIHNPDILENFSKEFLYLGCVEFAKSVKKGPLAEHSPMIDDISGVPTWTKVHSGMLKMYKAEVLEKVPIMQHFLFGSLIPW